MVRLQSSKIVFCLNDSLWLYLNQECVYQTRFLGLFMFAVQTQTRLLASSEVKKVKEFFFKILIAKKFFYLSMLTSMQRF